MKLLLALIILCLPVNVWAAAITSAQTGNWSAGATWTGGVKPGAGDTAVIATGHTITVDENTTVGSNAGAVGHAVTVQATNSTTYGKLIVSDGITLTLQGFDLTNNTMMLINQYAVFEPQPGAIIVGEAAGDYSTFISNKGIINAIGTQAKPITFTSPSGAYSWDNAIASEAFSGTAWKYDPVNKIGAVAFAKYWISNTAGNGSGSFGNTSVSFSAKTPATILATEVSALSGVTSIGTYYIDYDLGVVWFYHDPAAGNPSFTKTYKYLTVTKGWGISSIQNTTYNEAKFDHVNFSYMGKAVTPADVGRVLDIQNKNSATSSANKLAYVKNSTFINCAESIGLKLVYGTAADLIQITGNTFGVDAGGTLFGSSISVYRSNITYANISDNVFKARNHFFLITSVQSTPVDATGLKIQNNNGLIGASFLYAVNGVSTFSSAAINGNIIYGIGNAVDYRALNEIGGTTGNPSLIHGNLLSNVMRANHYASYSRFYSNSVINAFHHGSPGPGSVDDVKLSDIEIYNNLFATQAGSNTLGYDGSPNIEVGYNHRYWIDDFRVHNNTFIGNPNGWFGFGDMQDTGTYTLATRIRVYNNIGMRLDTSASTGASKRAISTVSIWRGHVSQFDYNLDYQYQTRYANITRQGTFSGLSNVAGVALWSPSFATKTGGELVYTYTSATDRTLTWSGGTPVQLVLDTGTATSASGILQSQQVTTGGTITNTGKAYPTTKTDANCPQNHWILITGGTGAGQIRAITNNTATVLSVAPGWSPALDTTSTYAIIKSEITLQNSGATETLQAGIYLPDLPTSTQTDSSISFADNSITATDPQLVNASGLTFADVVPQYAAIATSGYGGTYIGAMDVYTPPAASGGAPSLFGFGFGYDF